MKKTINAMLRVMIVDESAKREALLRDLLNRAGYEVVGSIQSTFEINQKVLELQPDIIIVDTDSPSRDTLEHICVVSRERPRPIVMFTHDDDSDKIRAAIRAGVSAYVVDGLSSERVKPVVEVAQAHFNEFQAVRRNLEEAETRLSERKMIDRAKSILMKQKQWSEDRAYQALRKTAMDRGQRIGEVASNIIAAADLLT